MPIGIFAKIYTRPSLAQTLDAITAHGMQHTQFNLSCAGLPTLPDELDPAVLAAIRQEFTSRQLTMTAISGTYNMIHPGLAQRQAGLKRLGVLTAACQGLGTTVITLCTGTRHPDHMWRRHPDNDSPAACRDLLEALEPALATAETHRVTLAIEPELSNVIDSAGKARRLLDELRSPYLKIVMDAANLFHPSDLRRMPQVLDEAFELLQQDIGLVHAKDLSASGEVVAAGKGVLDYSRMMSWLHAIKFAGPLILHSLDESEVAGSVAFLQAKLAQIPGFS